MHVYTGLVVSLLNLIFGYRFSFNIYHAPGPEFDDVLKLFPIALGDAEEMMWKWKIFRVIWYVLNRCIWIRFFPSLFILFFFLSLFVLDHLRKKGRQADELYIYVYERMKKKIFISFLFPDFVLSSFVNSRFWIKVDFMEEWSTRLMWKCFFISLSSRTILNQLDPILTFFHHFNWVFIFFFSSFSDLQDSYHNAYTIATNLNLNR